MPVRRLRALSAWSKARLVVLERKRAAVRVLQAPAFGLQVAEQLEDQDAREPHRVKRIGAAHVVEPVLQRRDGDRARPAAVALLARPADLGLERQALAAGAHADDLELGDQVLHQGIGAPSCEKNLPESPLPSAAITLRRPR